MANSGAAPTKPLRIQRPHIPDALHSSAKARHLAHTKEPFRTATTVPSKEGSAQLSSTRCGVRHHNQPAALTFH
jgi:hypothetical protein